MLLEPSGATARLVHLNKKTTRNPSYQSIWYAFNKRAPADMTLSTSHKELLLAAFYGGVNLDAIDLEMLSDLRYLFRDKPEEVACFIYPDKVDGTETVRSLYQLATNKLCAVASQQPGMARNLQRIEDECRSIYNSLPDYARW